ncbi:MAG TPA: ABC transporter substrate-binding protein [Candidatus Binatia bacterium]|nr:ABC transporter substrate-binding protein [Candidatus Binatia bacterium]
MGRALLKAMALCAFFFADCCVAAERVMIATPGQGPHDMPVVVAMRNGYFRKEGLDVYKIQIRPEVAVKALVAGEVDYNLALGSSVRAAMTGLPIKVVAAMTGRPMHVFVSRPEIRFARNLKGKTIGVDGFGGIGDYLSRLAARYLGLVPDKNLHIIEVGDRAIRLAALKDGTIDATVLEVVLAVKAEEEGFNRLVYLGNIIDLPISGIAVTGSKIAKHREQIKKVIRATLRGTRFIKQNRPETLRLMQSYLSVTPVQAAHIYDASIRSLTDDGLVSERAIALDARRVREKLPLIENPPLSEFVDWSLLGEIKLERAKIPFWIRQDQP